MPRYYKTSSATPLDYMYKLNTPLMEKVLMANDKYIGDNLDAIGRIGNLADSFKYLAPDEARAKVISDDYSGQVDKITKGILDNPAGWRNQIGGIKSLAKDLSDNYKYGEISKIGSNYSEYTKWKKNLNAAVQTYTKTGGKGGIDPNTAQVYDNYYLTNWMKAGQDKGTAYDKSKGTYNAIHLEDVMPEMNLNKELKEGIDKLKGSGYSFDNDWMTKGGQYFNEKKGKTEGVSADRILEAAMANISPQLKDYMKSRQQVGLLHNMVDDQGNIISPYKMASKDIDPAQINQWKAAQDKINTMSAKNPKQAKIMQDALNGDMSKATQKQFSWNLESGLTPILQGIVSSQAWSKGEESNKLRNNSLYNTMYTQGQENNRFAQNMGFKNKELDWKIYHESHPTFRDIQGKGTKNGVTKDANGKPIVLTESSVGQFNTNSFEDMMSLDGKSKMLSKEGLSSDINDFKDKIVEAGHKIKDLMKVTSSSEASDVEKAIATQQISSLNKTIRGYDNQLKLRRNWYNDADKAVLNNEEGALAYTGKAGEKLMHDKLTPEEISLYNDFSDDRSGDKYKSFLEEEKKDETNKMVAKKDLWSTKDRVDYDKYMAVKAKVDNLRDNFLTNTRRTVIDSDAINIGSKDNEYVTTTIGNSLDQTTVFDQYGHKSDIKIKPEDMIVNQVGGTTKIGNGSSLAKIYLKKDKKDKIGNTDKPYYIQLSPGIEKQIGIHFMDNKNGEITSLANKMTDGLYSYNKNQLIQPSTVRASGQVSADKVSEEPFTIDFAKTDASGKTSHIPLNVTKFAGDVSDQDRLFITDNTGKPLASKSTGTNGWFNGIDDFLNQYQYNKGWDNAAPNQQATPGSSSSTWQYSNTPRTGNPQFNNFNDFLHYQEAHNQNQ